MPQTLARETQTLREFQEALFERLRTAGTADAAQASRLAFESGGRRWLMRLDEAHEVIAAGPITPVPLARAWFRGLANLRGNLFSIIDLACLAGSGLAAVDADTRLVVLAERYHLGAAMLVERVSGLRSVNGLRREPADRGLPAWVVDCVVEPSGERWHELSVGALVQSADFLQTGL
jgi:twitching motility protein PilI